MSQIGSAPARTSRSPILKALAVMFLFSAVMVWSVGVVGAVATYQAGMIKVKVQEKHPGGADIGVYVPAILVNMGLRVAPAVIPDDVYGEASEEVARWRPLMERLADEIEKCPEGPLVEVLDGNDHVQIGFYQGAFRISVETPSESVLVSVPTSVFRSAVRVIPA